MAAFSCSQRAVSARLLFLQIGQLLLQLFQTVLAGLVLFFLQSLALDLQLEHLTVHLVQLLRLGIDLHAQPAAGFVDQVDGLVGQEAVTDIAVGQHCRGDHRRVLNANAVVHFVPFLEAAQNADRLFDRRLVHQDRLETPLQGGILFDILPVLVQGGGAHTVQLTAGQQRLEHVAGIHRPLGSTGADHGMQLVDKDDNLPFGVGDLF